MKIAIIVVTAVLSAFAAQAISQEVAGAERPVLKPGDSWTYQRIDDWKNAVKEKYTLTVSTVSDKEIQLTRKSETSGKTMNVVQNPDLNILAGSILAIGSANTYSPNSGIYDFPLTVGKTWDAKSDFVVPKFDRTGSYKLNAKVVGWEKVKVPAGEFDALKISEDGFYRSTQNGYTGTGSMGITFWYAPAIKAMVKTRYEDTWNGSLDKRVTLELLGYKVN